MTAGSVRDATELLLRTLACGTARCACAIAERRGHGRTHCPVHVDLTPSLNVDVKGDNLLIYCHGSCGQQTVVDALRARDLWPEDAKYATREEMAHYEYRDPGNKLLCQVVRFFPKDFRQRKPTSGGGWEWNLDGVPKVLYRLPDLLAADAKRPRWIVEGEKDVDRLWALGIVATCNIGGAGKWRGEYNEHFRDKTVVLVVDNDDAGRNHCVGIAEHLRRVARKIVWLELPGLDEHGDMSDWLDDGGTKEELADLFRRAPQPPTILGAEPQAEDQSSAGAAQLLSMDSVKVVLNGPNGPIEFLFAEMEKNNARELETEVSIHLLQPGTAIDAYTTRLNILSASAREITRREVQDVLNLPKDLCAKLLNRAYDQARKLFLGQDRTMRVRDIVAPPRLEYAVGELLLQERPTILFGPGGSLKTYVTMSLLLAMTTGTPWLGRTVRKKNCMLIDYESGPGTTKLRLRRLAMAMELDDVPSNLFVYNAAGIPLDDLVEPLKRSIDRNQIGFLAIDHCAAAAGTEPEKAEAALRFYRALGKLHTPTVAIAHVTGDIASNPESAKRPFGSIFWDNGAGLTWFLMKEEQEESSPEATLGLFQKKWNDTGRLRDFSVKVNFDGDDGPIDVLSADLRDSTQLTTVRGQKDLVYLKLAQPMTVDELRDETSIGPAALRTILRRYPGMFQRVTDSNGRTANTWQRVARHDFFSPPPTETTNRDTTATASPVDLEIASQTTETNNRDAIYRNTVSDGALQAPHPIETTNRDIRDNPFEIEIPATNGHVEVSQAAGGDLPW